MYLDSILFLFQLQLVPRPQPLFQNHLAVFAGRRKQVLKINTCLKGVSFGASRRGRVRYFNIFQTLGRRVRRMRTALHSEMIYRFAFGRLFSDKILPTLGNGFPPGGAPGLQGGQQFVGRVP